LRPDFYSVGGDYFGAANRPYVKFDSVSGYKYISGKTRLCNVAESNLVYDHIMPVNNRGYCSVFDYDFKKTDTTIKRLIVFGDSYSAGEITDTTWVDLLRIKLAAENKPTELLNFSLEATGISGWNNVFFKEMIPNYDFDGIVLAVFGDVDYYSSDLARPFVIKNSSATYSSMSHFETLPLNENDFKENYKGLLYYESSVYDSRKIDQYKALALKGKDAKRIFEWMPPRPYFLNLISENINFIRRFARIQDKYYTHPINVPITDTAFAKWESLKYYYGEKILLTKQMLDYCQANNKEITLVSIPSFRLATSDDSLNYHNNFYNRQLRFLAKEYDARFIDGYTMLDSIPDRQYDRYHLYGDAHWNRAGIDLFIKAVDFSGLEK